MKKTLLITAVALALGFQLGNKLDSPEMELSLTPEEFSDVVKVVWDEVKKNVENYTQDAGTKGEFETTAEYETRVAEKRAELSKNLQAFATSKKLHDRTFVVWIKADLVKYDADAKTYTLTTPSKILVPPRTQMLAVVCPPNPYLAIEESVKRGYKFAYVVIGSKPEYTWHVDRETAQQAKADQQNIYFRVALRFDISRVLTGSTAELTVRPLSIGLFNQGSGRAYWQEDLSR